MEDKDNNLVIHFNEEVNPDLLFVAVCKAWSNNVGELNIVVNNAKGNEFTTLNLTQLKKQLLPAFNKFADKINNATKDHVPGFYKQTKNEC